MHRLDTDESLAGDTRPPALRTAFAGLLLAVFALASAGCEQEGPAERAGEKIDESVEAARTTVEEAAEEAGEQAREIKEEAEEEIKR